MGCTAAACVCLLDRRNCPQAKLKKSMADRQAGEEARIQELERQLAALQAQEERAAREAGERQHQLEGMSAALQSEAGRQGGDERVVRAKVNGEEALQRTFRVPLVRFARSV